MNNILALEHSGQIYLINIKEAPIEIDDVVNKEHYDLKNSVTLHSEGTIVRVLIWTLKKKITSQGIIFFLSLVYR
ncbi:hypothetical protein [Bacillus sp. 123MFChir2]|uniref:hypothetical protein n=1 Tax=Bacillus sp. 123MFChir2 TaxID=1169144 RepID=UPI00037196A4|nr:hypothetical protein [Bacillus sp. 123MFChir2]